MIVPEFSRCRLYWRSLFFVVVAFPLLSGCGGGGSSQVPTPPAGPPPPSLQISAQPGTVQIVPGNSATFTLYAYETNDTTTPTVTMGPLPTGVTTTTVFPLQVPSGGAMVTLQADPAAPTGEFQLQFSGQAGAASANAFADLDVEQAYDFFFDLPPQIEIAVPFGGVASASFNTGVNGPTPYTLALSVSGLPPGTTASFTSSTINPGSGGVLTIKAAANARTAQNVPILVVATPSINGVPSRSIQFFVDVTAAPGQLPNNRTSYLSLEGSPYWAAYDSRHQLIFASNPSWNRVDVINETTRQIIKSIPIRDPRGVDMAVDNSRAWLTTGSQRVYEIDPVTLTATLHVLPNYAGVTGGTWEGNLIYSLSDGTLLLNFQHTMGGSGEDLAIWNPATNTMTQLPGPSMATPGAVSPGLIIKSLNGAHVYSISGDSSGRSYSYDVALQSSSPVATLGGYAVAAAANYDGSMVAVYDSNGLNLYDGDLQFLAVLPGGDLADFLLQGGLIFSPTNGYLYELGQPLGGPSILVVQPEGPVIVGSAPALPLIPVMTERSDGYELALPMAVDSSGIIIGLQDFGISFDDSSFYQNLLSFDPPTPTLFQHMSPYFGPLSGGTTSSGFGESAETTPDIWYGPNRGTAVNGSGFVSITSPPTTVPGPVDLKFLFPDGVQIYNPLFFSYGPEVQYSAISGSSPAGGTGATIAGFGMPLDGSGGTLKVGSATAAITTVQTQYLPFVGTPYPNTYLNYTVPPGSPGWADITVQTPDGSSTLPKSFFYAKSVDQYSGTSSYRAILYDSGRNQLYLSASDHIDVFSLTTNTFLTPIKPPALGTTTLFAGMTLTPDGSSLLVADLMDGSLAVVNLNTPAASTAIPVAPINTTTYAPCVTGPSYVAATSTSLTFVTLGGVPGTACGAFGPGYMVDLVTKNSVALPYNANCTLTGPAGAIYGAGFASSSHDGGLVALFGGVQTGGFCMYNVAQGTYTQQADSNEFNGGAISGDGNVAAFQWEFVDSNSNLVGRVGQPAVYYNLLGNVVSAPYPLNEPQLNDTGSLYYIAYPQFIDIIDVQHGVLRIRFALRGSLANTFSPMAVDSSGQHIYLATGSQVIVIDLGEAPLSVGSVNPTSADPGAQIMIRGSGFVAGTSVTIGGQTAAVTFVDAETLQVTVPTIPSGAADLVLTNPDGTTYTLSGSFSVP